MKNLFATKRLGQITYREHYFARIDNGWKGKTNICWFWWQFDTFNFLHCFEHTLRHFCFVCTGSKLLNRFYFKLYFGLLLLKCNFKELQIMFFLMLICGVIARIHFCGTALAAA